MNRNTHLPFRQQSLWLLGLLMVASVLSTCLMIFRCAISMSFTHCYLVWNLFLAWIPIGFAMLAWRGKDSRNQVIIYGSLWLLFFPNAPYIVTDLVHLRERPPIPVWFDILLMQSFIWLGLLLGFISLYWMHNLVATFVSRRNSWLFVLLVVGLTGFGIYLGRFQRWNSWDIVANPINLLADIARHLFSHNRRMAGVFSILYAAFLLVGYLLVYALTFLKLELRPIETTSRYES